MAYTFLYISIVGVFALFLISIYFKKLTPPIVLIGVTTVGYSLVHDILLGDQAGLFHYINRGESTLYMVLSAILIYPLLNMIYILFLPIGRKAVLIYTGLWILAMLLFEYASVVTKTIVFTGWRPIPWSFVVYVVTYLWINFLYRYLNKRMEEGRAVT